MSIFKSLWKNGQILPNVLDLVVQETRNDEQENALVELKAMLVVTDRLLVWGDAILKIAVSQKTRKKNLKISK